MNDNPATEYTVWFPEYGEFLVDVRTLLPLVFPTRKMAEKMIKARKTPAEIYTRLNYTVTPWEDADTIQEEDWA